MEITIRKMEEHDAPDVHRLSHQLGYPVSLETITENIIRVNKCVNNDLALVAESTAGIIGWIYLRENYSVESPPFIEIAGLVVDNTVRRAGIGRQLVQYAIHSYKESGRKIRVRSNIARKESHLFYKALGFAEIKQQQVYELK